MREVPGHAKLQVEVHFPPEYRVPLQAWLEAEFGIGAVTEAEAVKAGRERGLFLCPCITDKTVVFALLECDTYRMRHAMKMDRVKGDEDFLRQLRKAAGFE